MLKLTPFSHTVQSCNPSPPWQFIALHSRSQYSPQLHSSRRSLVCTAIRHTVYRSYQQHRSDHLKECWRGGLWSPFCARGSKRNTYRVLDGAVAFSTVGAQTGIVLIHAAVGSALLQLQVSRAVGRHAGVGFGESCRADGESQKADDGDGDVVPHD